jgi:N-acyl-D-amino-acid deacylase
VGFKPDSLKRLTGKTLAAVAEEYGVSPEDVAVDLLIKNGDDVSVVYFMMDEGNMKKQLRQPWLSFCSDGAALAAREPFTKSSTHPRAYGNFVRVLGKYVRDEQVLTMQDAVRKLSALPASNLKLRRRGMLKPGNLADVVVFDPATVTDHATFENPHQYATGVKHVFVNGAHTLADGEPTGVKAGRVVRGPGWTGWRQTP